MKQFNIDLCENLNFVAHSGSELGEWKTNLLSFMPKFGCQKISLKIGLNNDKN